MDESIPVVLVFEAGSKRAAIFLIHWLDLSSYTLSYFCLPVLLIIVGAQSWAGPCTHMCCGGCISSAQHRDWDMLGA